MKYIYIHAWGLYVEVKYKPWLRLHVYTRILCLRTILDIARGISNLAESCRSLGAHTRGITNLTLKLSKVSAQCAATPVSAAR